MEALKQKKLGIGSLALLLSLMGVIWSCNVRWLDNFCLGDTILGYIGIPSWSNGLHGTHYTVFYGLIFFISAFMLGMWKKNDLFAAVGRWIAGFLVVILGVMSFFFV